MQDLCIDCHKAAPVHRYAARCAKCREHRMDYCDLSAGRLCSTLEHVSGKSNRGIVVHRDRHKCGHTHVYVGCNEWGLNYCPFCREPMDDGWERSHPMFGPKCGSHENKWRMA